MIALLEAGADVTAGSLQAELDVQAGWSVAPFERCSRCRSW